MNYDEYEDHPRTNRTAIKALSFDIKIKSPKKVKIIIEPRRGPSKLSFAIKINHNPVDVVLRIKNKPLFHKRAPTDMDWERTPSTSVLKRQEIQRLNRQPLVVDNDNEQRAKKVKKLNGNLKKMNNLNKSDKYSTNSQKNIITVDQSQPTNTSKSMSRLERQKKAFHQLSKEFQENWKEIEGLRKNIRVDQSQSTDASKSMSPLERQKKDFYQLRKKIQENWKEIEELRKNITVDQSQPTNAPKSPKSMSRLERQKKAFHQLSKVFQENWKEIEELMNNITVDQSQSTNISKSMSRLERQKKAFHQLSKEFQENWKEIKGFRKNITVDQSQPTNTSEPMSRLERQKKAFHQLSKKFQENWKEIEELSKNITVDQSQSTDASEPMSPLERQKKDFLQLRKKIQENWKEIEELKNNITVDQSQSTNTPKPPPKSPKSMSRLDRQKKAFHQLSGEFQENWKEIEELRKEFNKSNKNIDKNPDRSLKKVKKTVKLIGQRSRLSFGIKINHRPVDIVLGKKNKPLFHKRVPTDMDWERTPSTSILEQQEIQRLNRQPLVVDNDNEQRVKKVKKLNGNLKKMNNFNKYERLIRDGTFESILRKYSNLYNEKLKSIIVDQLTQKGGITTDIGNVKVMGGRVIQKERSLPFRYIIAYNEDLFKDPNFVINLKHEFAKASKSFVNYKNSEIWIPFAIVENLRKTSQSTGFN
ncbi:hypothetical protein H8356DRAFT_641352 [Neocallimastix lanati (nom. inval.)]|nr:hypothetical protein H8356DRAFT_641352 [Neocallimastix sp. JGI-2020a]